LQVIESAAVCFGSEVPGRDVRLHFVADDEEGVALEVVAVVVRGQAPVIHAMGLRERYRPQYKETRDVKESS
jgi:hypothetical protein